MGDGREGSIAALLISLAIVYDAWAKFTGTAPQTQARLALYRGQQVFNTVPFNITGVFGINDVQGGTCGTCHNNPNVGNHTSNVPMDIGVTAAGSSAALGSTNLDISGLPVFTVLCTTGSLASG